MYLDVPICTFEHPANEKKKEQLIQVEHKELRGFNFGLNSMDYKSHAKVYYPEVKVKSKARSKDGSFTP